MSQFQKLEKAVRRQRIKSMIATVVIAGVLLGFIGFFIWLQSTHH